MKPTLRTPKRANRFSKVKEAEAFAVHAELKGQEMSEEPGTVGELAHPHPMKVEWFLFQTAHHGACLNPRGLL